MFNSNTKLILVPPSLSLIDSSCFYSTLKQENTGVGIASKIREVANEPGTEVTDVCAGLKLLREGQAINYQGASGNVDIDANGDVVGVYDVWTVNADGTIQVIDKVNPIAE